MVRSNMTKYWKLKKLMLLVAFLGVFLPLGSWAESTKLQPVTTIQVASTANGVQYYFYGPSGWGAPSCPANYIAYTTSGITGGADLYAAVVLSKIYARNVVFVGTCQSAPYFFVTQILVE